MKSSLHQAMVAGAFGLSSGLCYAPATFADPDELRSLASVLASTGGVYSTHIRNETDLVLASIREAVDAVRDHDVPLHISHLKVAGRSHWGLSNSILDMLDEARAEGVDVTADVYPYAAASTMLHSLLPPWMAEGGLPALLLRLGDPAALTRVAGDLVAGIAGWQNLGQAAGWDRVVIASASERDIWEGHSIAELAEVRSATVTETIARVLRECDGKVVVVIGAMDDTDVARLLRWPHSLIGSDGIPLPGTPHPRLTGTFPRVLSRYRTELGGLERAVHRMTGASAQRFAIPGRGLISSGSIADLVVFDADAVSDRSTYERPWLTPSGINHVLMAGDVAVWDGEVVNGHAGRVLQRQFSGLR